MSVTARLGLTKPNVASLGWGTDVNTNFDVLDAAVELLTSKNAVNGYAGLNSSGQLAASQLPVPAAAAKGGVFSKAAVSHNFLTSISNVDGSIGQAQPSAADLTNGVTGSGAVVLATSPTLVTPVLGAATATTVNGVTIPSVADTAALLAATQTLTNKTLGGTTPYKRLRANGGSAITAAQISISAGWGSTASVSAVRGTDALFEFKITASGTGQAANPTITITWVDGTWTTAPFVTHMPGASVGQTGTLFGLGISSSTATAVILKMDTITPTAGATYAWTIKTEGAP